MNKFLQRFIFAGVNQILKSDAGGFPEQKYFLPLNVVAKNGIGS